MIIIMIITVINYKQPTGSDAELAAHDVYKTQ